MDLADEPVRGNPFGHRVGIEECPIDAFGWRAQYAVKADGVGGVGHDRVLR
jgi:hypothetical protein